MKVLLLTQVLPYPPDGGPKIKTWNLIKFLAVNHEITLISFVRGEKPEEINELKKYCRDVITVPIQRKKVYDLFALLKSFLTGKPWLMVRDDRKEMREAVEKAAAGGNFEIVHADQHNMAQYALSVQNASHLLDAHNVLWMLYKRTVRTMGNGYLRWIYERDWQLFRSYEKEMVNRFDAVITVSENDRLLLEEVSGKSQKISVIPIAIDTDQVLPVKREKNAMHIIHVGTMFWQPNIDGVLWFIKEVFPLIKAQRPDIIFDIIGARPPKEIVSLSDPGRGINVCGYVEDVEPFIQKAALMIVPVLAGGGMRVKILNALSQEIPLVSTSIGCEGIEVVNERDLLIADKPQEFSQAVLKLLEDRDFAELIGKNGRDLIQNKYDYRQACRPIEDVYKKIVNK